MTEEKKSEEKVTHHQDKVKLSSKIKKNPWILTTAILGTVLLILGLVILVNSLTNKTLSPKEAGEKLLDFYTQTGIEDLAIVSVDSEHDFYKVEFTYQGDPISCSELPCYITKDGKNMISSIYNIEPQAVEVNSKGETKSEDVPKSDKPSFEAFVSPYCPYGLQYMKGLIPVYNLLKDKANIKIRLLSPTHIKEEEPEIIQELCIQDIYGEDVYFNFLSNVIYNNKSEECYNTYHGVNLKTGESISSTNVKNSTYLTSCLSEVNDEAMKIAKIDKSKVQSCISSKGESLYSAALKYNENYNIGGSPSPFINKIALTGASAGRSPEAIKEAICSSFTEKPSECSTSLSDVTYSPGMGDYSPSQNSGSSSSSLCG